MSGEVLSDEEYEEALADLLAHYRDSAPEDIIEADQQILDEDRATLRALCAEAVEIGIRNTTDLLAMTDGRDEKDNADLARLAAIQKILEGK